jgi:hypothetical protein
MVTALLGPTSRSEYAAWQKKYGLSGAWRGVAATYHIETIFNVAFGQKDT